MHNRANLRREKTKFLAKKLHARTIGGPGPPRLPWLRHWRNISHMWGEAPANDNATKFGTGVCPGHNHTCQILR